MGCISSKRDINDLHHNIFQVMNVDELGNRLNPGQLEITETDLVLYQRRKPPVKWPLRCLRRYGFDAELFSFESGRRCPTGPGIYAFRCKRAEQLFNLLQTYIQVRNNAGEDAVSREFPVPSVPGPAIPTRGSAWSDSNYLDLNSMRTARTISRVSIPGSLRISQNGGGPGRLSSVGSSSNGPMSPQGTASPSPPPVPVVNPLPPFVASNNPNVYYANEELFLPISANAEQSDSSKKPSQTLPTSTVGSVSTAVLSDTTAGDTSAVGSNSVSGEVVPPVISTDMPAVRSPALPSPSYINVDLNNGPLSPTYNLDAETNYALLELTAEQQQGHVYMNVIPGPENGIPTQDTPTLLVQTKPTVSSFGILQTHQEWDAEETRHCYANLEPGEIEVARSHVPKHTGAERLLPLILSSNLPASQSQQIVMTPPPNQLRQVNYIVLDLDQSKSDISPGVNGSLQQQPTSPVGSIPSSTFSLPPESPHRASEGYATIDFNKTVALSHSVNPSMDNDSEGSRKTRHNSTISDLIAPPTRHSSSE